MLDSVRRIVHSLHESSRRAEQQVGLTGAQLYVLQALANAPVMSVNDLAAQTHTHQSSVSVVVSRLVRRRLVRRAASSADRRRLELSLTARGRQAIAEAPDVAQGLLVQGIERLPATRRRLLASALGELARAMDAGAGAPAMFFEKRERRRPGAVDNA